MEGIFGIRGIASGEIYMHGKKTRIKHPIDAMNAGIGLITEDRRGMVSSDVFPSKIM